MLYQVKKFTLVELLAVIALLLVLLSMLQPALNRSITLSESVKCSSNLKQIGYTISSYTMTGVVVCRQW